MLFKLKDAKKIKRKGFTAFLYSSKEEFPVLNTVYANVFGFHEKVYVKNSYRIYFILEGKGTFIVGKKKF